MISALCDHRAALILREYILLRSNELKKNEKKLPYAHTIDNSDQFSLIITNPPINKSGVYHIYTGEVFETN